MCGCSRSTEIPSAVVLSQVQATTTGQPIKVPQFVPPPRLTPRPTFQPQVRPSKTCLHPDPRPRTSVCGPTLGDMLILQQGAAAHQSKHSHLAVCCLFSPLLLLLCFFWFVQLTREQVPLRFPACVWVVFLQLHGFLSSWLLVCFNPVSEDVLMMMMSNPSLEALLAAQTFLPWTWKYQTFVQFLFSTKWGGHRKSKC